MLKQSQVRTNRASLVGCVDVEHAGQHLRLLRDDPNGPTLNPREAADDVAGEVSVNLGERSPIDDAADDRVHVVGLFRRIRDRARRA